MCHFKLKMGKERIVEVLGTLAWYDKNTVQLDTDVGTWTPPGVPIGGLVGSLEKLLGKKKRVEVIATVKLDPKPWSPERECDHWHLLQAVRLK